MVTSPGCSKHAWWNSSSVQWFMPESTRVSSSPEWSLFLPGCFPYGSLSCLCGHLESHSDTAGWIQRPLEISNFVQKTGLAGSGKNQVIHYGFLRCTHGKLRGTHGLRTGRGKTRFSPIYGFCTGCERVFTGFSQVLHGDLRDTIGFQTGFARVPYFYPSKNCQNLIFSWKVPQILFVDVLKW